MGEQVERGYRELFEHSAVGMAEVTLQGVFRRVNKMFCQMIQLYKRSLSVRRETLMIRKYLSGSFHI